MTPLYLQLLMPAVQVIGAGLIISRVTWRHHPALITWLLSEVFFQALTFGGSPAPHWTILAKTAILSAVCVEVLQYSRIAVGREAKGLAIGAALVTAAFLSGIPVSMTVMQRAYLFRSYFLLAPAAVLIGAALVRAVWPVLECRRHKAYRIGAALWIAEVAISGAFVKGGVGYRLLPYTRHTWDVVNLATYAALIVTVTAMSLAIRLSVSPRKRAAQAKRVEAGNVVEFRRSA